MPTYEYKCNDCGGTFEAFQNMTAAPLTVCRECGGHQVKRLLGCGAGIIFKGSGFYETDYRKKTPAESKSDNGGKASSVGKTAPKSDSAAAEKNSARSGQPEAAD